MVTISDLSSIYELTGKHCVCQDRRAYNAKVLEHWKEREAKLKIQSNRATANADKETDPEKNARKIRKAKRLVKAHNEATKRIEQWEKISENWNSMPAEFLYPSCYANYEGSVNGHHQILAWVSSFIYKTQDDKWYDIVRVYEPERTNDSSTHYGWGRNVNGYCEQEWPAFHCPVNGKKYTSVDEFKADWESIKATIESGAAKSHGSGYIKYDSMDALIEHKGIDGVKDW
jgi:hypothetical protein